MTIILFIFVLLVCVLVHEWGHYIVAKKSGMLVEEFGFGIPPRLWSWKKGETTYSINALPIGGFVRIAGENGFQENAPTNRQFESKTWYQKTAVLVAGVVCNFLLAFVLFTVAYTIGLPGITPSGTPTVVSVVAGSPTEEAGVRVGDKITGVAVGSTYVTVLDTENIRTAIQTMPGDLTLSYTRAGEVSTATIVPEVSPSGKAVGIAIEPIGIIKQPFFASLGLAWKQTIGLIVSIFSTIGELIAGLFTGEGSVAGLVGPVGLAREVGSAANIGPTYLLAFIATISLNLAALNILPFPALDGGRLVIVWGEALTRRRFSPKVVGIVHMVGFLLLISLMFVLTVGDIRRVV
jgi:regulator of sigma E protease